MRLALLWKRIFASRITTAYFIFSILHCIVQVILQIRAFTINDEAATFLSQVAQHGRTGGPGFAVLTDNDLRWCDTVPHTLTAESCAILWSPEFPHGKLNTSDRAAVNKAPSSSVITNGVQKTASPTSTTSTPSPSASLRSSTTSSSAAATATPAKDPASIANVVNLKHKRANLTGVVTAKLGGSDSGVGIKLDTRNGTRLFDLDNDCVKALNYPVQKLKNTKREDIAFLAFQFWLLGMSIAAMLNESIPHIIMSLSTHAFATGWSIFQVVHTNVFHHDFTRSITNGACSPHDLLPDYWAYRRASEIPSLAFNAASLVLSIVLTWLLIKQFGWRTYKNIGSNLKIRRIYDCVSTLSILLQLSLFFMIAGVSLWLDQLYHGPIAEMAANTRLYEIGDIIILVLTVPWLVLGWYSVRKESRWMMIVFLLLTFSYVVCFSAMFISDTFRWTFITWVFFGMMETIAAALAISAMILGVMCRINFGKGLKEALLSQAEDDEEKMVAPDEDDFVPASFGHEPYEIEKIDPEALSAFVNVDLYRQGSDGSSKSSWTSHEKPSVTRNESTKKRWAIDD